jgi:hypothetical protein
VPRSIAVRVIRRSGLTLQHLRRRLGKLDEDTIVDLEKSQKLEGLPLLGVNLVDTVQL